MSIIDEIKVQKSKLNKLAVIWIRTVSNDGFAAKTYVHMVPGKEGMDDAVVIISLRLVKRGWSI